MNYRNYDMWEITDIEGTIYSGYEDEISIIFQQIKDREIKVEWTGDLRLIQIHDIHR